MSEEYGGRVELAKAYYKGLSDSLSKNFRGSGLISSMQQCNDFFLLGTRQISMGRVGKRAQPNSFFTLSLCFTPRNFFVALFVGYSLTLFYFR